MSSFFAELKRRNVYRVAAAYAVVAWVLLQLVNNVAPILELPPWIARAVLMFLVLGFPVALIFAWIFEASPEGVVAPVHTKTGTVDWILAGALATVIAIFAYQQFVPASGERTVQAEQVAIAGPAPAGISIAVLPLVNLSGDPGQEFFSDGMTEEITAALAKVPGLRVLGRTSAFEFKGQNRDLRMIGQALGATHLIEGSVRKVDNRVRITAQLVRASDDSHLWAENYDRDLTDVFAIQEEIAKAIAASLRVPLGLAQGDTLVRSRTKDEATYEDYLRAKGLVRARGFGALTEAAKLLEQAVAREPDFAPAWALLALGYALTPIYDAAWASGASEQARPRIEMLLPKAEAAANRAVQLDPRNPDGYIALGAVQHVRGKYLAAWDFYSRALALDADNPDVLHLDSSMLAELGYAKEALRLRQRLQAQEPFVPVFADITARVMWIAGQTDAAIETLQSAAGRGYVRSNPDLARIYAGQARFGEAAGLLLATPADAFLPERLKSAAQILRGAPTPAASAQTLPQLGALGFVYLYVGASDRFMEFAENNLKIGYLGVGTNLTIWAQPYASIRKTERFKAYVRAAGMVDYWRVKGWPDFCHPVGAGDFVCD